MEYRRISNARTEHGRQYVGAGYSSWTASNPAGRLAKESMSVLLVCALRRAIRACKKPEVPRTERIYLRYEDSDHNADLVNVDLVVWLHWMP